MSKYSFRMIGVTMITVIVFISSNYSYAGNREIGGYVAQAEPRFVRNVWNFVKEFQSPRNVGAHTWKNDQYFWARDYFFKDNSHKSYVDAQDLVFISGHGNSYIWQTIQDPSEIVNFRNVPGYGDVADNGDLEFLVIESCSTVATAPEATDWWTPWKKMFQGLHQLCGFRTVSYSDNGIPNAFAKSLKNNRKIWRAWFDAVNSERSWYRSNAYPGYASAIMASSCADDRLGSYAADPSPDEAYTTWWQH